MKIRFRRGTTAQWSAANPVLLGGEPGIDLSLGVVKVGDGTTAWTSLGTPAVSTSGQANIGQIYLFDRVGAPPTPSGGGILYSEGGSLKFIGSAGTVTILAPA